MPSVLDRGRAWATGLVSRTRDPLTQSDLLQVLKSAVAATVAWVLAVRVFDLPQPFLAPWAALLTVHATVYRSVWRGVQQVAATVIGVLLSFAVAEALGITFWALGLALFIGLLASRIGVLREEGVTIATTALFVLTTGFDTGDEEMLIGRVLDTVLGIGVGVAVNLLVIPPLNNRSAEQYVDAINRRLGRLLETMAAQVRHGCEDEDPDDWIRETRHIDRDLDHAWQIVSHANESWWFNPRGWIHRRKLPPEKLPYEDVLRRLEDGVSEARSMARTIRQATIAAQDWDARFRDPWLDLTAHVGAGVYSAEKEVEPLRDEIADLRREMSVGELPELWWPTYGALLTNLTNIVDVVDDVASSKPVRT